MLQKNVFHFQHDFNARNDEKIVRLRMKHGAAGYGIYFMLLERLAESSDHRAGTDYDLLSYEIHTDAETVRSVVEDFNLFEVDAERREFYSASLIRRLAGLDAVSEKRRAAANSRWAMQKDANAMQTDASAMQLLKKEKEKKREEKKEEKENPSNEGQKKTRVFRKPSIQEVMAYCAQRNNGIDPQAFVDFYESKGWRIGNTPMKDWMAAIRTWERKRKTEDDRSAKNPNLGIGEYITTDGRRTYGDGRATIPLGAPKRPSAQHIWDCETNNWVL